MSTDQALEIMREDRGTHFDAGLLDCFVDNLDAIERASAEVAAASVPPNP
jgi:HD-GYP domain-containing protein (c-di-GMP phosphodiesterase class II)